MASPLSLCPGLKRCHAFSVDDNDTGKANGERPLAANDRSQWHHDNHTPMPPRQPHTTATARKLRSIRMANGE